VKLVLDEFSEIANRGPHRQLAVPDAEERFALWRFLTRMKSFLSNGIDSPTTVSWTTLRRNPRQRIRSFFVRCLVTEFLDVLHGKGESKHK
jgi:hypothetical protein